MSSFEQAGLPFHTPVTENRHDPLSGNLVVTGIMSQDWQQWFFTLMQRLNRTPQILGSVSAKNKSAAIPVTEIPLAEGAVTEGLYRAIYNLRLTTVASVSSRLQIVIWWLEGGGWKNHTGRNMTEKTAAAAFDSGNPLIRPDANTKLYYEVLYASNAANQMQFAVDIAIETVPL